MMVATYRVLERNSVSAAVLALLAGLVVVTFHDGFRSLAAMWQYSSYAHGYLVPLVSIYLLVTERHKLADLAWDGSYIGVSALGCTLALWLAGRAASIQAVEHFTLISMIICFLWAVAGNRLLLVAWFPFFYLYLALPVGESLVPVLQTITADVASAGLRLFGIASYRDGWYIALPGGDFEVAKACSGLRYLNAGVSMAVLISYLVLSLPWARLLYVLLVAALFVFVNGIRAFLVMYIASATNMRYMAGEDHVWFGYVLFVLIAGISYWLAVRMASIGTGTRYVNEP